MSFVVAAVVVAAAADVAGDDGAVPGVVDVVGGTSVDWVGRRAMQIRLTDVVKRIAGRTAGVEWGSVGGCDETAAGPGHAAELRGGMRKWDGQSRFLQKLQPAIGIEDEIEEMSWIVQLMEPRQLLLPLSMGQRPAAVPSPPPQVHPPWMMLQMAMSDWAPTTHADS